MLASAPVFAPVYPVGAPCSQPPPPAGRLRLAAVDGVAIPDLPGPLWARRRLAAIQIEFVLVPGVRVYRRLIVARCAPENPAEPDWSQAELERLASMRAEGLSYKQCSEALPGRSRNACISKSWRLGLPAPPPGEDPVLMRERRATLAARVLGWARPPDARGHGVDPTAIACAGKTFLDLGSSDCRWPFGEGRGMRFCGEPRGDGEVYCPEHGGLAFRGRNSTGKTPRSEAPARPAV